MAIETEKYNPEHTISLISRKELRITGVNQLICFDDLSVKLSSVLGEIEIFGNSLTVDSLDLDKGFIYISGEISGLEYVEDVPKKKKRFWS